MTLAEMKTEPISALSRFVSEQLDSEMVTVCPAQTGPSLIRHYFCSESTVRAILAELAIAMLPALVIEFLFLRPHALVVCRDKVVLFKLSRGMNRGVRPWWDEMMSSEPAHWQGEVHVLPLGDIGRIAMRNSFLLGTSIKIEAEKANWTLGVKSPQTGLAAIPGRGWKWSDFTAALQEVLSVARPDLVQGVEEA